MANRNNRNTRKYLIATVVLLLIFVVLFVATYWVIRKYGMTLGSALVYASIVTLLVFLLMLVFRYFSLLFLAVLDHTRDTLEPLDLSYTPFVSIIVPAYNEGRVIRSSIQSLIEQDYPNYEVIVVDDGSTDDTYDQAKQLEGDYGKCVVRVITKPNEGKAIALNTGIAHSRGEIIVAMDGDSRLEPQTLRYGVRHFREPDLGAVAGNVKVINRNKLLTRLQALEYVEGLNFLRRAQAFFRVVSIVPGPIGFFRRAALEDVGYYDNDTFAEDCDLTLKLIAKGWKIRYEPNAVSWTEAPESWIALLRQRYRWTRGILQSIRKHKIYLFNPFRSPMNTFVLWSMVFEALMWPGMNLFAHLFFLTVGVVFGLSTLVVFWWAQLTILDMMAALFAIAIERESLLLLPYSVLYRLIFFLVVDTCKIFATIEELLGLRMTWGKLERAGRL